MGIIYSDPAGMTTTKNKQLEPLMTLATGTHAGKPLRVKMYLWPLVYIIPCFLYVRSNIESNLQVEEHFTRHTEDLRILLHYQ